GGPAVPSAQAVRVAASSARAMEAVDAASPSLPVIAERFGVDPQALTAFFDSSALRQGSHARTADPQAPGPVWGGFPEALDAHAPGAVLFPAGGSPDLARGGAAQASASARGCLRELSDDPGGRNRLLACLSREGIGSLGEDAFADLFRLRAIRAARR